MILLARFSSASLKKAIDLRPFDYTLYLAWKI